jgi:hypothetical protein
VFGVEEDVAAPKTIHDLLPGYKMAVFLDQQDEQLHGQFFEPEGAPGTQQLVAVAIELELVEFDDPFRQSGNSRGRSIAPAFEIAKK